MVKISKNAKKILALTLAGVMTVGTVVPGSALSTVENVQAGTAEDTKAKEYIESGAVANAVAEVFAEDNTYYIYGTLLSAETQKKITDKIKTIPAPEGYTVEKVEFRNANVGELEIGASLKKDNIESVMQYTTFTTGADNKFVVDAHDAVAAFNHEIRVNISDTATPEEIRVAVSQAASEVADKITKGDYRWTAQGFDLKQYYDITITSGDYDEDKKTCPITVKATNKTYAYDTAETTVYPVFAEQESEVTKVINSLKEFKEITPDYGYDATDLTDGEASEDLKEAILKKAKEYNPYSDVTIDFAQSSIPNYDAKSNTFTGTFVVAQGSQSDTITLSIKVAPADAIKSVEVIGKIKDQIVQPNVTNYDFTGVAIRITMTDGTVKTFKGSQNTGFESSDLFTVDRTALTSKIGEQTVKINVKDAAKSELTLKFNAFTEATVDGTVLTGLEKVKSATTSDDALVITNADEIKKGTATTVEVQTSKAGTYTMTVVDQSGVIRTVEVKVSENGTIKCKETVTESTVYVDNKVDVLGIVATGVKSVTLNDGTNTDAVSAKLEGGKLVITANDKTPAGEKANITLTGGKNGKLTTQVVVEVADENKITVTTSSYAWTNIYGSELVLTPELEKAFASAVLEDGDNVIEKLGLTSNDELIIKKDGKELDRIPVTDASLSVKNSKLTVSYGTAKAYSCPVASVVKVSNDSSTLGLVGNTVSVQKTSAADSTPVGVDARIEDGKIVLTPKAGATTDDTVIVSNGDYSASIQVTTKDGRIVSHKVNPFAVTELKVPDKLKKTTYKLGEDFSATEEITFKYKNAKGDVVDGKTTITKDMLHVSQNAGKTFNTDSTSTNITYSIGFGGKWAGYYNLTVEPTTKTLANTDLGFSADETFTGAGALRIKDDSVVKAETTGFDKKVVLKAQKVNASTTVIATTNKGNSVTINVSVDKNGNISTNFFAYGKVVTIDNNIETLGLVGKNLVVSGDAVKAELNGTVVKLTGVKEGTSTVKVSDADGNTATITVDVDNKGNVLVKDISKFVREGWITNADGSWSYYKDGKLVENGWVNDGKNDYYFVNTIAVVSNWKLIDGTWYYFNKWGACIKNGWATINGCFYFFDKDGQMADSQWIKTGNYYYYVNKWGAALTNGWYKIDGNYYCFNKWGAMYTNTYIGKYYVNKWGAWDSRYDKK